MTGNYTLDRAYAELMAEIHPFGWALYKKVVASQMQPGDCGYFDSDGDWQLIGRIHEPNDLFQNGWNPSTTFGVQEPWTDTWGPKKSLHVQERSVGGTIGSDIVVAPVMASATLRWETYGEQGCVLVTEDPVTRHQVTVNTQIIPWIRRNIKMLTKKDTYRQQAADYGLWVVTKTYTTRRCAIAMMTTKSASVEISVAASAEGLFVLEPGVTWGRATGGSSTDVHQGNGDEDVVVFMSGLHFWPRPLLGTKEVIKQKDQRPFVRGSHDGDGDDRIRTLMVQGEDGEEMWNLELWGRDED